MLATLEGKRQVTASVKLQQCDWQPQQSAASRFVGSETGVEKVKRKQLQLTGPQVLLDFEVLGSSLYIDRNGRPRGVQHPSEHMLSWAKTALLSIKDKRRPRRGAKIENVNNIVEPETAKFDDNKAAKPETVKTEDENNIAKPETAQIEDNSKIVEPKETAEWECAIGRSIDLANSSGNSSNKLINTFW